MADNTQCGTNAGYRRHQYYEEQPCKECVEGKAAYDRELRSLPHNRKKIKVRTKAQGKAISVLVDKYRAEYQHLYKTGIGNPNQRQRQARTTLVRDHRGEYQELYRRFKDEIEENISQWSNRYGRVF